MMTPPNPERRGASRLALSPRSPIALVALALSLAVALVACHTRELSRPAPNTGGMTLLFEDDFEREALGDQWVRGEGEGGSGQWRIEDGWLVADQIKNDPLWWAGRLPDQARVEFDAQAMTDEGDLKVEIFGDGKRHESGYIVIFGGWKNALDVIARLDEHGDDRKAQPSKKALKGRTYRLAVERRDSELKWFVDDELVMSYPDAKPLKGPNHRGFAFNDWAALVRFDRVKIYRLE